MPMSNDWKLATLVLATLPHFHIPNLLDDDHQASGLDTEDQLTVFDLERVLAAVESRADDIADIELVASPCSAVQDCAAVVAGPIGRVIVCVFAVAHVNIAISVPGPFKRDGVIIAIIIYDKWIFLRAALEEKPLTCRVIHIGG